MIAIFPEIVACVQENDIERLAMLVRRYYGGNSPYKPALDWHDVLDNAGIQVEARAMEERAILCVKDERGSVKVVAFLNNNVESQRDQNFLMAHLLGHFILHVQAKLVNAEWRTSGLKESMSPMLRYAKGEQRGLPLSASNELEADEFAAAILMPKAMIQRAQDKISDFSRLAQFFDVESMVLARRLEDLNGRAEMPANFLVAETQMQERGQAQAKSAPLFSDQKDKDKAPANLTPKSFAANTYSDLDKRTATAKSEARPASAPVDDEKKARQSLERIRKLAKRIDQSVD